MVNVRGAAIAAALLASQALSARAQTQPLKLAYVNSAAVLQSMPDRAQAESTFQRDLAGYQQQVGVLQARLDSAVNEFNRAALVLSPAAKERRQQELVQMRDRTQQQVQDLQSQAAQRQQQLMAPILQRIQGVIDGIRAEYNYAMIFDVAAQNGSLLSADRSLDITPLVIQRLQSGAGQQPPAAQPPAAPAQPPASSSVPSPARPPRATPSPRP